MTRRKWRPRETEGHAAGMGGAASAFGHTITEAAGQAAGVGGTEIKLAVIKEGEALVKEAERDAALQKVAEALHRAQIAANKGRHDQAMALKTELQKIADSLRKRYRTRKQKAEAVEQEILNRIEKGEEAWPHGPVPWDYIYKHIR